MEAGILGVLKFSTACVILLVWYPRAQMAYLRARCFESVIDTTMLDGSFVSLLFSGWPLMALSMPQLMYILQLVFVWCFLAGH
jgi:hypothetical protein